MSAPRGIAAGVIAPRAFGGLTFGGVGGHSEGACEEPLGQIGPVDPVQLAFDLQSCFRLIPEEETTLRKLLVLSPSGIDLLLSVGIPAGVVYLRGERHRSRGEVLDLFETEVEIFGDARHGDILHRLESLH